MKKYTNYEWLLNHMVRGRYRYIIVRVKDGLRWNKHTHTHARAQHLDRAAKRSYNNIHIVYTGCFTVFVFEPKLKHLINENSVVWHLKCMYINYNFIKWLTHIFTKRKNKMFKSCFFFVLKQITIIWKNVINVNLQQYYSNNLLSNDS